MSWLLKIILLYQFSYSIQFTDQFDEELFIKQLHSGHINTYFQFTTKWNRAENDNLFHTNLIARPMAELFSLYNIKELHVSLTHGLWRYDTWGYPTIDAAPGAEIWAWFYDLDGNEENINIQWKNLCSSLSGLLCASLSFIDETNTLIPTYSFRPEFNIKQNHNDSSNLFVRYGTLPHEIVCTENLTPWKKLLPCSGKEGFASLLNPDQIYNTNYHSIGIHFRELCDYNADGLCTKSILELKQSANLVFDPLIIDESKVDWSIRKLFGHGLNGYCILAESSKIYIDTTDKKLTFVQTPTKELISQRGGNILELAEFDMQTLPRKQMHNIAVIEKEKSKAIIAQTPPLYAKRYILGVGQERGNIVTKITNSHWSPLSVIVQENIPWFVPIYIHTLTLKVGEKSIKPVMVKYIPGELRKRPYQLEVGFEIPARSSLELSIDFDYIFLKWLEYPPDANHGHYIGSAVISAYLPVARNYTSVPITGSLFRDSFNATKSGYLVRIRTEILLITLPTPDFSMPYNVICLACTVVALAFGPIHNIATKKLVLQKQDSLSFFAKLKRKFFKTKD